MIESFYNARTGAIANNYGINVLSNNISNINTVGYKTDHTTFSDTLYTNLRNPDYAGDSLQAGHGSRVNAIASNMEQGALEETGYPLHFAIHGEGFFAIEDENQNIYYTRAGNFQLSNRDGEFYLTDTQGNTVLDVNYSPILVEGEAMEKPSLENLQIGLFEFANNYGLQKVASTRYQMTEESQDSYPVDNSRIKQGYLENSNVFLPTEMTNVIRTQRAFQANTKIIQMADEMEQILNNLR